jgi:hypothetical protein
MNVFHRKYEFLSYWFLSKIHTTRLKKKGERKNKKEEKTRGEEKKEKRKRRKFFVLIFFVFGIIMHLQCKLKYKSTNKKTNKEI